VVAQEMHESSTRERTQSCRGAAGGVMRGGVRGGQKGGEKLIGEAQEG
jgi:hypothetical protein